MVLFYFLRRKSQLKILYASIIVGVLLLCYILKILTFHRTNMNIHIFNCAFHWTKLWYHRCVPPKGCGGEKKWEEIIALGASAYLFVCRRHATLLALCNTHSGWRGAGSVRVVLTVASCPSAAAAQHVTPLDHIAACCATVGACPFPCPIGGTTCGHHSGPSPCCTGGLGHKHGHRPSCASSHWDG